LKENASPKDSLGLLTMLGREKEGFDTQVEEVFLNGLRLEMSSTSPSF